MAEPFAWESICKDVFLEKTTVNLRVRIQAANRAMNSRLDEICAVPTTPENDIEWRAIEGAISDLLAFKTEMLDRPTTVRALRTLADRSDRLLSAAPVPGPRPPPEAPPAPVNVLLVDDNLQICGMLREFLTSIGGFRVRGEAICGPEAIEKVTKLDPDVVVLDLVMANMNGLEMARKLKQVSPRVFIVLYSIYAPDLHPDVTRDAGIDAVVSKAEDLPVLTATIRQMLSESKGKARGASRRSD